VCLSLGPIAFVACDRSQETAVEANGSSSTQTEAVDASPIELASPSGESSLAAANKTKTSVESTREGGLDEPVLFKVMSWNLEWFFDDDAADNYSKLAKEQTAPSRVKWDWKRDAVAESLSLAQPAIVAFQEIENRRVLWYLSRAMARNHNLAYREICIDGSDVFTEQDVGFLYRDEDGTKKSSADKLVIEPTLVAMYGRNATMRRSDAFAEVSKHVAVEYELNYGNDRETVTIVNLHLRAKDEAVEIRTKQARTVHAWIADKIRAGENVIVLGDFNTEESKVPAVKGSDMYAACGLETPDPRDDLIDLHVHLSEKQRQTHLLPGKAFDRILVSRSLLEDDIDRVDLSFVRMERLKELSVKGNPDVPQEHWDNYWDIDDANRDISDHWPIMATFQFK
jgi:exonuclease III